MDCKLCGKIIRQSKIDTVKNRTIHKKCYREKYGGALVVNRDALYVKKSAL